MHVCKGVFGACGSELEPLTGAIREGFLEQETSECDLQRCGMRLVEKQEAAGLSRKVASPEGLVGVRVGELEG